MENVLSTNYIQRNEFHRFMNSTEYMNFTEFMNSTELMENKFPVEFGLLGVDELINTVEEP